MVSLTPKEKAKELVDKFLKQSLWMYQAKGCALIAVDEILGLWIQLFNTLKQETIISGKVELSATYVYWQEVKQEINNI